jgi:hypothetical protein
MKEIPHLTGLAGSDRNQVLATVSPHSRSSRPRVRHSPQATESPNAHPDPRVWVPALVLLALSLAAYCLFWAKITGSWPFGP